ncbi:gliding motility-associated-like protein [Chitinophaga skermanii]|uniref:Gliding motility-associated-like protein n=1 Tax=Chitinophaga skermanii TaxID=331697 RepID=A0A327QE34_9BACT|nr:T9SS type B sorting domain-containing protein [Chitinophaga skermanii]RAJ02571.1 gliding motility-associated-like protein [Chitinophaga skermanii]
MKSLRQHTLLLVLLFFSAVAIIKASQLPFENSYAPTPFSYNTTCINDSVFFHINADTTLIDSVLWTFGDPGTGHYDTSRSMRKPWHIYTVAGTYTVTLTVFANNTSEANVQFIRFVVPTASPFGEDTTLCVDSTLTLRGPVIPGAAYLWQDSSTLDSFVVSQEGTYKLSIDGCAIKDSINVFYTPMPTIALGRDVNLCVGEIIQLDATAQNTTYRWNTGETTPTIDVTTTGDYWVEANAQGCGLFYDTIHVNFTGTPYAFNAGTDSLLCAGETIVLDVQQPTATAYRWSTGATTPAINVNRSGDYWVFVTINGICDVLDTVRVRYNSLRDVNLGNDTTLCTGNFLVLTADYGQGSYLWQDGSKQATFYVDSPGIYYVHAQIGRCESTDSIQVSYEDTLRINLGLDTMMCSNETLILYPNGAGSSYKWQDSTSRPSFVVTQPGYYALVATNTCGRATDSIYVDFKECGCRMYFPTAFTPNGDGINDAFRPRFNCALGYYRLSIFDRWGKLFFYTTDPGVGWNGKFGTDPAPVGAYTWMVQYGDAINNKVYQQSGSITLIR